MTSNKNVAVETQFKNWLIENYPKLNKNKINRKGNGERRPHLRFYKDCGLQSFDDFLDFFKSKSLKITFKYKMSNLKPINYKLRKLSYFQNSALFNKILLAVSSEYGTLYFYLFKTV